jgi:hypothetical protein
MQPRTNHSAFKTVVTCSAALLLPFLAGCPNTVPVKAFDEVQSKLQLAQEENLRIQQALSQQQQANKNLQEQLGTLRTVKAPLEQLVYPVKIELERLSGGYGVGKPYDEGVVLYVQPMDRDNDVIKTAGTIQVKLYDLQNPPNATLIGQYDFDAQKTRSLWYGRMWTYHFTVKCPFPKPPAHDTITANVTFTSLITGEPLTAQGAYKIRLPAQLPATRPR